MKEKYANIYSHILQLQPCSHAGLIMYSDLHKQSFFPCSFHFFLTFQNIQYLSSYLTFPADVLEHTISYSLLTINVSKKSIPVECHRSILALFCLLPRRCVHFLLVCQLGILEKVTISLQKDQEGQVYIHLTSCNCKSTMENKER